MKGFTAVCTGITLGTATKFLLGSWAQKNLRIVVGVTGGTPEDAAKLLKTSPAHIRRLLDHAMRFTPLQIIELWELAFEIRQLEGESTQRVRELLRFYHTYAFGAQPA